MDVTSSHSRDPVAGWDITASAKADKGEKIARAQILVNEFSEYDEQFSPPISSWQQQLRQKGDYPGDNKVQRRNHQRQGRGRRIRRFVE